MNPLLKTLAAVLVLPPLASAQDDAPLSSGPSPGTDLTPVPCYATDGPFAGREFDAAAELGKAPGALLFIHELTRNTAPVLRGLDDLAAEFSILGFKSFTIMLSGDRTAAEAQLERVNGSLRLANPIVLSTDGAEGPGNYALNRKAALTLVFAKDGAVAKSLALTDTGPNDIPMIREAIEKLTGELPENEAALRELITANLPGDPEALKQLAADQALELRRLRAQMSRVEERGRGGMQRQPEREGAMRPQGRPPRGAPDPDTPVSLQIEGIGGDGLAELYFEFTGKRVIASEEAQRAEFSLMVPGQLTYGEAAKVIEEKLKLEGVELQSVEGSPGMLKMIVTDPSKLTVPDGGPPRARRVPNPPARPDDAVPQRPREGKPPEDAELQSLLRSYIRKTNDEARIDELFAEIEARAGESDELSGQAVEMFKLMLSIDYGNEHAQKQAQEFLKERAPAKAEE